MYLTPQTVQIILSGLSAPSLTDRDASIFGNNILFRVFFATVIDAEQAAGAF